jgi:hypothetical protein
MPYPLTGSPLTGNLRMQQVVTAVELGNPPTRTTVGLVGAPRTAAVTVYPATAAVVVPRTTGQIWPRSGG